MEFRDRVHLFVFLAAAALALLGLPQRVGQPGLGHMAAWLGRIANVEDWWIFRHWLWWTRRWFRLPLVVVVTIAFFTVLEWAIRLGSSLPFVGGWIVVFLTALGALYAVVLAAALGLARLLLILLEGAQWLEPLPLGHVLFDVSLTLIILDAITWLAFR